MSGIQSENDELVMFDPTEDAIAYWNSLIHDKSIPAITGLSGNQGDLSLFENGSALDNPQNMKRRPLRRRLNQILENSCLPDELRRKVKAKYLESPHLMDLSVDKVDPNSTFLFDVTSDNWFSAEELKNEGFLKSIDNTTFDKNVFENMKMMVAMFEFEKDFESNEPTPLKAPLRTPIMSAYEVSPATQMMQAPARQMTQRELMHYLEREARRAKERERELEMELHRQKERERERIEEIERHLEMEVQERLEKVLRDKEKQKKLELQREKLKLEEEEWESMKEIEKQQKELESELEREFEIQQQEKKKEKEKTKEKDDEKEKKKKRKNKEKEKEKDKDREKERKHEKEKESKKKDKEKEKDKDKDKKEKKEKKEKKKKEKSKEKDNDKEKEKTKKSKEREKSKKLDKEKEKEKDKERENERKISDKKKTKEKKEKEKEKSKDRSEDKKHKASKKSYKSRRDYSSSSFSSYSSYSSYSSRSRSRSYTSNSSYSIFSRSDSREGKRYYNKGQRYQGKYKSDRSNSNYYSPRRNLLEDFDKKPKSIQTPYTKTQYKSGDSSEYVVTFSFLNDTNKKSEKSAPPRPKETKSLLDSPIDKRKTSPKEAKNRLADKEKTSKKHKDRSVSRSKDSDKRYKGRKGSDEKDYNIKKEYGSQEKDKVKENLTTPLEFEKKDIVAPDIMVVISDEDDHPAKPYSPSPNRNRHGSPRQSEDRTSYKLSGEKKESAYRSKRGSQAPYLQVEVPPQMLNTIANLAYKFSDGKKPLPPRFSGDQKIEFIAHSKTKQEFQNSSFKNHSSHSKPTYNNFNRDNKFKGLVTSSYKGSYKGSYCRPTPSYKSKLYSSDDKDNKFGSRSDYKPGFKPNYQRKMLTLPDKEGSYNSNTGNNRRYDLRSSHYSAFNDKRDSRYGSVKTKFEANTHEEMEPGEVLEN